MHDYTHRQLIANFEFNLRDMTREQMEAFQTVLNVKREELIASSYDTIREAEAQKAKTKSAAAAASRKRLKEKGRELGRTIEPGDMVRVVGVRDRSYPWRLVTEVHDNGDFSGWQACRKKDGTFVRGKLHTTMQTDNIREVVKDV